MILYFEKILSNFENVKNSKVESLSFAGKNYRQMWSYKQICKNTETSKRGTEDELGLFIGLFYCTCHYDLFSVCR